MNDNHKPETKQSFIAEARREQIIEAAIRTLDDIGYVHASLAQIAKRAGISTALISYHFADKHDLMNHLLMKLVELSTAYVLDKVRPANTPEEKLEAIINASLAYQGTHPAHNTALIEIVFNARTPDNIPYYKLDDEDEQEEPLARELKSILQEGQRQGVFGDFHADVMCKMIQGAISEYMLTSAHNKTTDLETYSNELVKIVKRSVGK